MPPSVCKALHATRRRVFWRGQVPKCHLASTLKPKTRTDINRLVWTDMCCRSILTYTTEEKPKTVKNQKLTLLLGVREHDARMQSSRDRATLTQSSTTRMECLSCLCFLWHCVLCRDALWFKDGRISEFPASQPITALRSCPPSTPPQSSSGTD